MVPSSIDEVKAGGPDKRSYVRSMFTAIAPRYDLLNHVLSLNIDRLWRRRAIRCLGWEPRPDGRYLDLCAGTLDLAVALHRERDFHGTVVGADFVLPMLALGRRKVDAIRPVTADALQLPFPDRSFDGAMVGFGVRNLADLDTGLVEAVRVLRSGARLVILEFTTPRFWPMRTAYLLYFRRIVPAVGRLISRHQTAYTYLPASVLDFPDPEQFTSRMERAGLVDVTYRLLTGGIAAIHWGTKR